MPRTVVVLSPRLGAVLPAEALPALRAADQVWAESDVPDELAALAGAQRRPRDRPTGSPVANEVLLTLDPDHDERWNADVVITTPEPSGAGLLDAVAVMDRLRSPGGCPWDAEQTHTSLLQYLIEECYELHQTIEDADRDAFREELGDVLLQVLFHARLAEEGAVAPFTGPGEPFGVSAVAADLVAKLVSRHPHVFEHNPDPADHVRDASDQERRWDELKRAEKSRESALDGVAVGQPAAALVAKFVSRSRKAGVPEDLITGPDPLFDAVARIKLAGDDPEQRLRTAARGFAAQLRTAESAARAEGLDQHQLDDALWRRFWPT